MNPEDMAGAADDRALIRMGERRGPMGTRHPQHEVERFEMLLLNHRRPSWMEER